MHVCSEFDALELQNCNACASRGDDSQQWPVLKHFVCFPDAHDVFIAHVFQGSVNRFMWRLLFGFIALELALRCMNRDPKLGSVLRFLLTQVDRMYPLRAVFVLNVVRLFSFCFCVARHPLSGFTMQCTALGTVW